MVVAVAMIGSLTVLPGDALVARRPRRQGAHPVPRAGCKRDDGESRVWGAMLGAVLRRPLVSAIASTAVLVALALPALQPAHEPVGLRRAAEVARRRCSRSTRCATRSRAAPTPAVVAIKGDASDPAAAGGGRRPEAAGARVRQGARADLRRDVTRRHGAPRRDPARRRRHGRRRRTTRSRRCAPRSCPRRSARCRASSTRSRATRRRRRTGTRR